MGQTVSSPAEREAAAVPRPVHPAYVVSAEEGREKTATTLAKNGSTTFTLTAFSLLTLALTAKAFRSSQRLRQAEYDARAWRKAFMRSIDRMSYHDARHIYHKGRDYRAGRQMYGGIKEASHFKAEPKVTPPFVQSDIAPVKPAVVSEVAASVVPSTSANTSGIQYKAGASYSAIHPHEDWDWVPSDHPPKRNSWKRTRLPPWAIGFSSTVKASPPGTGTEAETRVEASEMTPTDREEELLRAYIWPDSDPLRANEAATIAEEVFKEATHRATSPIKEKEKEKIKRPSVTSKAVAVEQERVRDLERQVWALLERTKELEDRWGFRR